MRILLCDRASGLFLQTPHEWTSEARLARDFHATPKAILFANENGLKNVDLYWDFEDPEYNVHLPILWKEDSIAA
jgi:hypothetical protein